MVKAPAEIPARYHKSGHYIFPTPVRKPYLFVRIDNSATSLERQDAFAFSFKSFTGLIAVADARVAFGPHCTVAVIGAMEGALLRSIHGNVVEVDAQTRHLTTDRLNALESMRQRSCRKEQSIEFRFAVAKSQLKDGPYAGRSRRNQLSVER